MPSNSTCQSSLTRSFQNGITGQYLSECRSGSYFAAVPKYITALTTPQIRKLLREGVLRPVWLTPYVYEVTHGPVRLGLRRSEAVRRKAHRRRHDKLAKLHALM